VTKYAALIYTSDVDWSLPEYADVSEEYGKFGENNAASIRGGEALFQTSTATVVRVKGAQGGEIVTTDGPYAETKEALTGFYVLDAADLDAAIALAAQIPAAWDGAVELRPVIDYGQQQG
jgi:hypothetical protein